MKRVLAGLVMLLWVLLLTAIPASADNPPPDQAGNPTGTVDLREVRFDPHPGAQLPRDLTLQDENGQSVRLGDFFGSRPIVFTLNDFNCQNLCPLQLQTLADTMVQVPFKLGGDYQAISVSINPRDGAEDATATKAELMHRYSPRHDVLNPEAGWHFLTADQATIDRLTQTVGFRYAYDAQQEDFAHPVGTMILTPDGRVARYLYGMDFPPNDLRLALTEASQRTIGNATEAVLLLCYHYSLTSGRYTPAVMTAVRAVGIATVLALGGFLGVMWRRDFNQSRAARQPGGTKQP
jgi:protein SCO1/2